MPRENVFPRGWANGALGRPHGRPPLYHPQPSPTTRAHPAGMPGFETAGRGGGGDSTTSPWVWVNGGEGPPHTRSWG